MSLNTELNRRLFIQREQKKTHVEYNHEYGYYNNVAEGNVEEVKKILASVDNEKMYDGSEYGQLSKNPLNNTRYHFVVSVALITRLCAEKGLERELAYTLSDLYIGKMDLLNNVREIILLHNEMLLDFANKMADLPKKQVYSLHVIKAIEYISRHRNDKLTVETTAKALNLNRSYLSTLFKKETGVSIGRFIRHERIEASANMLRFSDYSYADIAEYFGFSSQSHFIQCFRIETGYTPKEYREKFSRSQEIFG